MLRNKIVFTMLAVVFAAGGLGEAVAADGAPAASSRAAEQVRQKVVIQVSDGDPRTWNQALNVIKNIQEAYGKDKVDVELVVFGNGIGMLKMDSEVGNRISDTMESGAKVLACENTMRGRKLVKEDMLASIGYVPAGVVEIITRQKQGWAVIRP
ncbi:MAG: DsrE family protein [Burkholderiales bacterium]